MMSSMRNPVENGRFSWNFTWFSWCFPTKYNRSRHLSAAVIRMVAIMIQCHTGQDPDLYAAGIHEFLQKTMPLRVYASASIPAFRSAEIRSACCSSALPS